jgi:ATP-dependent DNA helicase 2 subunit 1
MNEAEDPWGAEPAWAREDYHDDDEEDGAPIWFGAQHVVALIDCSRPDMYVPCIEYSSNSDDDDAITLITPLDAALVACERLCRDRVLRVATQKAGKRDGVGVLLYGTQKPHHGDDEEEEDDEHHAIEQQSSTQALVELYPPGVTQIRTLRSCLNDTIRGRQRALEDEFVVNDDGQAQEVDGSRPIRLALQEANKVFSDAKFVKSPRVTSIKNPADKKSIWIFTNHDNPAMLPDELRQLTQMMQDIAEGGTEFVMWALPKANSSGDGAAFDSSLVYDKLCHQVYAAHKFSMVDMLENVGFQGKKPRRVYNMPMLLPDWKNHKDEAGISVDFYKLVQEQKKPQLKWIHQSTKQQTERVTQTIIKETGEVVKTTGDTVAVSEERILYFATFGTDQVPISPYDVAAIKKASNADTGTSSLILLGFKPQNAIPITHTVDKTYFIYPNDEGAEGSTEAFANLHAAMIRKNVVAIGELLTRVTTSSRMVAIFPQAERLDDEGDQVTPPGMIVVSLPYEDDVRKMQQETEEDAATDDLIQEAIDLIRHQRLDDIEVGLNFENAAIHRFWNYIEAVALETTTPTKEQFETELNEEEVMKVAGAQIEAFRDSLPEDVKVVKKSRAAPRKRKIAEAAPDESGMDWAQLYSTDSLDSCKVDALKSYLRSIGARMGGRKEELVFRVSNSISEKLQNGEL